LGRPTRELLYADDLVLMAETEDLLADKIRNRKRVWTQSETKATKCEARFGKTENLRKWSCGLHRKIVGSNSIK